MSAIKSTSKKICKQGKTETLKISHAEFHEKLRHPGMSLTTNTGKFLGYAVGGTGDCDNYKVAKAKKTAVKKLLKVKKG